MLLLSLECLPRLCTESLKLVHDGLSRAAHVAFVAAGPVASSPAPPRPLPAAGDPYHELHAVLQRIRGVTTSVHRHSGSAPPTAVCVLDGWVPPGPAPHPVLMRLCLATTLALLPEITSHRVVYFRGCPHESFERVLDAGADEENPTDLAMSLGDIFGAHERLDAIVSGVAPPSPFRVTGLHVIPVPPYADDNPQDVSGVASMALRAIRGAINC